MSENTPCRIADVVDVPQNARAAFMKLRQIGAEVYVYKSEPDYDFVMNAQADRGETFVNYEIGVFEEWDGIREDVYSILEEYSMGLEWINPEQCGIWFDGEE